MIAPPKPDPLDEETFERMQWGFKLVSVDLTTDDRAGGRVRYPVGDWVAANPEGRPFTTVESCPAFPGDGLCVALTLSGAQSGGHRVGSSTMLQTGWLPEDHLCGDADKVRVRRLFVHPELLDPVRLIVWAAKSGADLYGADLSGADLSGANLSGANLSGADFSGAKGDLWTWLPLGWSVTANGYIAKDTR